MKPHIDSLVSTILSRKPSRKQRGFEVAGEKMISKLCLALSWYWQHLTGLSIAFFIITVFNIILTCFMWWCWRDAQRKFKKEFHKIDEEEDEKERL